jgi:2-amino-4-hydroxy-6-hydroxymethyldihydropteridine diphosphokinase
MIDAYLCLGSNIDAERHIRIGVSALQKEFGEVRLSPIYETVAVGFEGDSFLNLAAAIRTDLQPLELKEFLNQLEAEHGRVRNVPKFSDRTLDIDVLLYGDLYLRSPCLELPRTELLKYAHVLRPLADLAPDLMHPVRHQVMKEIWKEFKGDKSSMKQVELKFEPPSLTPA